MSSKRKKGNALELLMQSSKKQTTSQLLFRTVLCPGGCGTQVPEHRINEHLDVCFQIQSENKKNGHENSISKDTILNLSQTDTREILTSSSGATQDKVRTSQTTTDTDAFSYMMIQSKKLFSVSIDNPPMQRFHLHDDLRLTWTTANDETAPPGIIWTSSIQLKHEKVMLILSTSVVPGKKHSLVSKHSRLSVPVLKSMLQKAVRRRRPLPATRTAMELADKDIGELLRRLPIIVLEDSSLHPDLPLLVWLMAAESKDYKVPTILISKVLEIVHEIASCPWTDYHQGSNDENKFTPEAALAGNVPHLCETMVRSISLRAQYGGMACDVKMLKLYERIWKCRFQDERIVPRAALEQIGCQEILFWKDFPTKIHERAKRQSQNYVLQLVRRGLPRLTLDDLCIEGVDFHCSPVLDQIINHPRSYDDCIEHLTKAGFLIPGNQREWLMGILKQCMWRFSSGINHRRPLMGLTHEAEGNSKLTDFWRELIAPKATAYMRKYVKDRLVS